jgi:hypothetical protein
MKQRKQPKRFVVCVCNDDCDDLEPRKIYQVLPDAKADRVGYIRVVDESGEDYLYPSDYFLPIELPKPVEKALCLAA